MKVGLCPEAVGSHGGLSAGEDVSRLLGQNVLWLLWLLQGSVGAGLGSRSCRRDRQDLLLKLFIFKYPDLCENEVPLLLRKLLRSCILGGGGSQSFRVLARSGIHPSGLMGM